MLHIGQRVRIAPNTPALEAGLGKYRGEVGTVSELNVAPEVVGNGATALSEFPSVLFPAAYLIPVDDDHEEAFNRFMDNIDLTKEHNPWLADEV